MEKREVVREALKFKDIPYVPWHFKLTVEAKDKLLEGISHDPTFT